MSESSGRQMALEGAARRAVNNPGQDTTINGYSRVAANPVPHCRWRRLARQDISPMITRQRSKVHVHGRTPESACRRLLPRGGRPGPYRSYAVYIIEKIKWNDKRKPRQHDDQEKPPRASPFFERFETAVHYRSTLASPPSHAQPVRPIRKCAAAHRQRYRDGCISECSCPQPEQVARDHHRCRSPAQTALSPG